VPWRTTQAAGYALLFLNAELSLNETLDAGVVLVRGVQPGLRRRSLPAAIASGGRADCRRRHRYRPVHTICCSAPWGLNVHDHRAVCATEAVAPEDVTVRLRHSRVHAQDCRDCDTKEGMLDVIESEISLQGELSAEQRNGYGRSRSGVPSIAR